MHIFLVMSALVLLGVGIFANRNSNLAELNNSPVDEKVLSESKAPGLESEESDKTSAEETNVNLISVTPVPTETINMVNYTLDIEDFNYPGSVVITSENNRLLIYSDDDPDSITDWYKEKIKSMNLKIETFVVTKTNGNVNNKLIASSGQKLTVNIDKLTTENTTEILISLE